MATFAAAPKVRALKAHPEIAVTIATESSPPESLLLRGRADVTEVHGVVPQYARSAARYLGEEIAQGYIADLERKDTSMVRIALRPSWVGLLDFQIRLPKAVVASNT